jgi:hypothetical protein
MISGRLVMTLPEINFPFDVILVSH